MMKILNLKLVILLEHQNVKTFLQKVTLQIGSNKIKNVKIFMLLMILMVKKLLEPFMKKRITKNKSV